MLIVKQRKTVLPPKPVQLEIGDVLCGEDYLDAIGLKTQDLEGRKIVVIPSDSGFNFLAPFVNNLGEWFAALQYTCPFNGHNHYCWMYPIAVVTDDEKRYGCEKGSKKGWLVRLIKKGHIELNGEFDCIVRAMLGHGYTEGTLPCDGHGKIEYGTVPMDNNDKILVACWVWFNQ